MGVFTNGFILVIAFTNLLVLTEQDEKHQIQIIAARIKRCFVCRSRGDLGDCKDPFLFNATTAERNRAVDAQPCAAGWCAKIIEGKGDDYAIATERMCLPIPPQDQEQRCTPTMYLNKKVLMCFCKGDLCNTAVVSSVHVMALLACVVGYLFTLNWL